MRSLLFRTFLVAFILTTLALVTSTLVFTRTLTPAEISETGATRGYSGTDKPQVIQGAKVLWLFIREPSFALTALLPQYTVIFIFMWAGTLFGSHPKIRASRS